LKECSIEKMEGLSVLEGKFNEVLERLDVLEGWFNDRLKGWDVLEGLACTWRRAQWEDGKVGMYLQKGLFKKWKGWGVLEGKYNGKKKVGCACE
jgi:hypothetical protein